MRKMLGTKGFQYSSINMYFKVNHKGECLIKIDQYCFTYDEKVYK